MKLLFVHVETSGLDARTGEILELTYQSWIDGKRGTLSNDRFRAVGSITTPAFADAAKHNGYIEAERIECATCRGGFIERLIGELEACDGALAAVAPTLTYEFVTETARRYGIPCPRLRVYDVASMALPLLVAEKVPSLKLADLAGLVGKPAPKCSIDKVERSIDVFEECFRRYYKALVSK